MPKFRKKPIVVEAEQFNDKVGLLPFNHLGVCCFNGEKWYVETSEGNMPISQGDWIIKGIKGEFYPCKPDIFEATCEPV